MIFSFRAPTGQTGYAVELRAATSATVLQTIPLAESGISGEFFLTAAVTLAAGAYRVIVTKNGDYLQTAPSPLFWDGTKQTTPASLSNEIAAIPTTNTLVAITNATTSAKDEILSAGSGWVTGNTIAPNNAGIAALTALLTGDSTAFTATALQFAPTGSGGGGALTTTQAEKLAAIPSDNALSAITAALNSVRDNILAAGIGWETGNNIAPNNDGIAAILAAVSQLPAPNNAASDLVVDGAFTIAALANAPAGGGGGGSLTVGQDATLTAILNQATSDQVRDGDLYYRYKEGTNEEILKKKRSVIGTRIELIEEV